MRVLVWRRAVLISAVALIIPHTAASSETHFVSHSGSDTPPYTSWETAATSIQSAIDAASEGDTVLIAPGVYQERIVLKSGLIVRGRGAGVTVVDGRKQPGGDDPGGPVITCRNVKRVSVEGMSITRGGSYDGGGGIRIEDSYAILVSNCVVNNNSAVKGGGVYVERSELTMLGCVIEGNRCSSCSGSCDPYEALGGGIYALNSELTVQNTVVRENDADGGGGGVFLACPEDVCIIRGCEILANESAQGRGGGIECYCTGEITACIVAQNWSKGDAGGIWCAGGVVISGSLVACNTAGKSSQQAEARGGGIFHAGGDDAAVVNCVVANNWARTEGGGICWGTTPNIVNCTIVGNYGPSGGAGVFVQMPAQRYGTCENVVNCIVARNSYHDFYGCVPAYSAVDIECGDILGEGWISGTDAKFLLLETPPVEEKTFDYISGVTTLRFTRSVGHENEHRFKFLRAVDPHTERYEDFLIESSGTDWLRCYGRPTSEEGSPLSITEYALRDDSPCIDAGNNDAEYLPETDKAGAFRIYRGRDDWRVDMGAYEYGSRRFEISSIQPTAEPGHLDITWNSQPLPGKTYSIYFSLDLLAWTPLGSNIPSHGEATSWIDPAAGAFGSRFYTISSP